MMRRARERQQGKCNYEATRRTMETWRSYTTPCPVNRYGGPTTEGRPRVELAWQGRRAVSRKHINPCEGQTLPGVAHAVVARPGGLAKTMSGSGAPTLKGSSGYARLRYRKDEGLRRRRRIEQCPFCRTSAAPQSREEPDRHVWQWLRAQQRGLSSSCRKQLRQERGWCADPGLPPTPVPPPLASVLCFFSSRRAPPPFRILRKGQNRCPGQTQI